MKRRRPQAIRSFLLNQEELMLSAFGLTWHAVRLDRIAGNMKPFFAGVSDTVSVATLRQTSFVVFASKRSPDH
jgi:hypothetical protein